MRISPAHALTELERHLASDEPLDVPTCRRLALRITSGIRNPDTAALTHELICEVIDTHASNPRAAREQIDRIRPAIRHLSAPN